MLEQIASNHNNVDFTISLFILYINDMCEVSKLHNIILLTHDTSMFYSTRNIEDTACLVNNELGKLDIWFKVNKISFNVNKTNVIIFANKNNIDQQ